jgi:[acyl-carrier-protein] S-malonyltransferase
VGVAVIFPGQGTQTTGMGRPWRATRSWEVVTRAEDALGQPLAHLLLDASEQELRRTLEAQLAVFLQSLMAWHAVRQSIGADGDEPGRPVAFAGHSLGQLTALVASGALSLEDGIRLVARRAAATQDAVDRRPGRMAALVGADVDVAELACQAATASVANGVHAWVANDNAPGQVVIGGTPEGVEAAGRRAQELGVRRVIPLNVGGAFHTPLFDEARASLVPVLESTPFVTPTAPVVSNLDAEPHEDPSEWPHQLADHLVAPVRWRQSQLTLARLGATSMIEVGPGNVLAGLARRTVPDVPVRNVGTPEDVDSLLSLEVC